MKRDRVRRAWRIPCVTGTALLLLGMIPGVAASSSVGHGGFSAPLLIGFQKGNDWEPSVASDGAGNVYAVWAHFGGVPGCATCGSPAALLEVSRDGGSTFNKPRALFPSPYPEIDFNVKVNGSGAVFVSCILKNNIVVQRSTDLGITWTSPIEVNLDMRLGLVDKPGLAVQGSNVYVAFDLPQHMFVAVSHDGGNVWTTVEITPKGGVHGTLSLNAGGVVAGDRSVDFAWVGVEQSGNALGPQSVFVTRSTDNGSSWKLITVDTNLPPGPACPTSCGWDFLGPQMVIAVDATGRLYVLYNAGTTEFGAPSVWYRNSADAGTTWSPRVILSTDGTAAWHVFPAIDARAAGRVSVAWMDNSTGAYNVWYRTSSDGGHTWSSEVAVSAFQPGFPYENQSGFAFPYGDYFILNLDPVGAVHIAWGEGPNWVGPGNVFYSTHP